MCGIVGLVHRDPRAPVAHQTVRRMADAIRHRGPDDEGIHVDGPVGIGMRRLSIIDLAGGHQPVFNEDRSCAIVFNGEIYNYRELRQGLLQRGHVLASHSDTETIVHLYEDYGARCVEHLRGMFAFAIWDARRRTLFIARDRFGIKPLYYVDAPWGLGFSSELKALHAAGMTGEDLDWEAIGAYFRLSYVPAPRTPFTAVRKLEPGHTLTWEAGCEPVIQPYWDVPTDPARRIPDLVDEVRHLLDESVRAHLEADVPVAAFLSGGLDSSAIVSSMALAGSKAHVFTVRYGGSGAKAADESALAGALASRYGLDLTVVDVAPDVRSLLGPITHALDEPHADESALPTWALCQTVASQFKVALLGTGGDELFAGYRRHFGLVASTAWQHVPRPFRSAASAVVNRMEEPEDSSLGLSRVKRFLRSTGGSTAARYLSLQDRLGAIALFTPEVRRLMRHELARDTFERHGRNAPLDGPIRPALYLDYKTYLPDDLLHLADRVSMAHSLELRVPFVDHRMVEMLFRIPDRDRVGLLRPKQLLRKALRSRIPVQHFTAPKRGFVGPTAAWLRFELADMMRDALSAKHVREQGFFDDREIDRLADEHVRGAQNHEGVLWSLLVFMLWHGHYGQAPAGGAYRPGGFAQ